jgi:hypothetical protein
MAQKFKVKYTPKIPDADGWVMGLSVVYGGVPIYFDVVRAMPGATEAQVKVGLDRRLGEWAVGLHDAVLKKVGDEKA